MVFSGNIASVGNASKRCLKERGIDYDMVQSENTRSVDRLIGMFINNGYKTIIIFGGDSALNDAVNCLMQQEQSVRKSVIFGLIPNGVMNDFAHFWEFDEDNVEQTIDWLQKRRIRKIDLGCIRYKNRRGEACHRYFLNCINIGLIATIMNLRRRTRHVLGLSEFVIHLLVYPSDFSEDGLPHAYKNQHRCDKA